MKQKLLRSEIEQIGFEYVKLLLEVKYGCRVMPTGKADDSSTMEVWSPKGYTKSTMQVNIGSKEAATVAILVARIINGREVPIVTDYHLVKFLGVEGVYCLEEEKLQELLLDHQVGHGVGEDGCSVYSLHDRQLLLDRCEFIAA